MKMRLRGQVAGMAALLLLGGDAAGGQEIFAPKTSQPAALETSNVTAPVVLTLKHTIELALQNSKEIQVAKIQASVADRASKITRAEFMPNLYAGSGAGNTYGIPETPGGPAPSIFNVTYMVQIGEGVRGEAEKEGYMLGGRGMTHSAGLQLGDSGVGEKEGRWKGGGGGYRPALQLVSI